MSNMKVRKRPWKDGKRGTGHLPRIVSNFAMFSLLTAHLSFFSGDSIYPLLAHQCTLTAAELSTIISCLTKGLTFSSLLLLQRQWPSSGKLQCCWTRACHIFPSLFSSTETFAQCLIPMGAWGGWFAWELLSLFEQPLLLWFQHSLSSGESSQRSQRWIHYWEDNFIEVNQFWQVLLAPFASIAQT